jgi:hypothetical protein
VNKRDPRVYLAHILALSLSRSSRLGIESKMRTFSESTVEQTALACFESLGWAVKHGLEIALEGMFA